MEQDHFINFEYGKKQVKQTRLIRQIVVGACAVFFLLIYYFFITAPHSFISNTVVSIEENTVLAKVSDSLKKQGVIRSTVVFEFLMILHGGEKKIVPGDYFFESAVPVYVVANRILAHDFGMPQTKVVLPEGLTREQMADILARNLPKFNKDEFLNVTATAEGYLFPDTYFFFPTVTTSAVAKKLYDTFDQKTEELQKQARMQGKNFKEVVILASIVEKEAAGDADRKIIAGILQNRLEKGMRLQADATVGYVIHKGREEIKASDLKIDSPYNTYLYKGLPPAPISNPGLQALEAVLSPENTAYFYYIHDKTGTAHYAKTFEEHKKNIATYLK
jgi:UPF0755 protein